MSAGSAVTPGIILKTGSSLQLYTSPRAKSSAAYRGDGNNGLIGNGDEYRVGIATTGCIIGGL